MFAGQNTRRQKKMLNINDRAAAIAVDESKRNDTDEVTDNRSPRIDEYARLAGFPPARYSARRRITPEEIIL